MSDHQQWTFPWEDRTPSDYGIQVGPAMSEVANMTGDLPAGTTTTTTPTAATTANSSGNGAGTGSNSSSNSSSSTRLPACRGRTPAESLWSRVYQRSNARLGFTNLFGAVYFGLPATPLALPAPAITAAEEEEEEEMKEEGEKEIKEEGEE